MKLFNANVIDAVKLRQDYFDFDLPSVMIERRRKTFLGRLEIDEKGHISGMGYPIHFHELERSFGGI